jgi:hypothetical protein
MLCTCSKTNISLLPNLPITKDLRVLEELQDYFPIQTRVTSSVFQLTLAVAMHCYVRLHITDDCEERLSNFANNYNTPFTKLCVLST